MGLPERIRVLFDIMADCEIDVDTSLSCEIDTIKCAKKVKSFDTEHEAIS